MDDNFILQSRRAIQEATDRFFRRHIEIQDRMLHALKSTDSVDGDGGPSSLALLTASLISQPTIAQALSELGIDPSTLELPNLFQITDEGLLDPDLWYYSFEPWFRVIDLPEIERTDNSDFDRIMHGLSRRKKGLLGKPTKAYKNVRTNARLSLNDAIQGCLETKYLDDRKGPRGSGGVSTNDLVGAFAESIGAVGKINNEHYVNERLINKFCKQLSRKLDEIYRIDPSADNQQFVLYNDGKKFRIRPFGSWGTYQLQESPLPNGSLWIARSNIIQPQKLFSEDAIEELESLINSDAREYHFQKFFEEHPEFILGLGEYKSLHPQLIIHEEDGGNLIPDFFLEKINSDLCDLCDLKKPTAELVRYQKNRVRFRDVIDEAISQLDTYRNWFEDRANRDAFKTRYGLSAYRPKVVIIIGRKLNFYDDVQRIQLESNLPSWVILKTYDDIVDKARQWTGFAGR